MELARDESGNVPKRFGLDMSKDFIPMSAFSESSQGSKIKFLWSLFFSLCTNMLVLRWFFYGKHLLGDNTD